MAAASTRTSAALIRRVTDPVRTSGVRRVSLLAPDRGSDGRRRYRDADVYRVAVILQAKELGFGLDHIRDVLQGSDRPARHAVLEEHLDALERTIASAEAAKRAVEHALACPEENFLDCPEVRCHIASRIPPPVSRPAG